MCPKPLALNSVYILCVTDSSQDYAITLLFCGAFSSSYNSYQNILRYNDPTTLSPSVSSIISPTKSIISFYNNKSLYTVTTPSLSAASPNGLLSSII